MVSKSLLDLKKLENPVLQMFEYVDFMNKLCYTEVFNNIKFKIKC